MDTIKSADHSRKSLPDFVIIGKITRPHGVRGTLRVEPITDDPQRYNLLSQIYIHSNKGPRTLYTIENVQTVNRYILLNLQDINTRNDAEAFRGCYIEIPRQECIPLPEGEHYYFELIGFSVISNQGKEIGELQDVYSYPANDVYVVKNNEKEILIPAVDEFIDHVDYKTGTITINPIEGLLD
ncbi:16S rRNA processing protein RimM [candidate division KSB1 bacterium]|nr:16S rRNA processing protein RimM [candidate division KSB1 bacterium]